MYIFLKKKESLNICYKDQTLLNPYEVLLYIVSLLSFPQAQQLYDTECLHSPGHRVTVAVHRETVKDTHCIYPCVKHHMNWCNNPP
jgi:hypothetical protein